MRLGSDLPLDPLTGGLPSTIVQSRLGPRRQPESNLPPRCLRDYECSNASIVVHTKMTGGIAFTTMQDYVEKRDGVLLSLEDADINVCKVGNERYAYTTINRKKQNIHRVVMRRMLMVELPKHLHVDHINHNKLDNRRENLRLVTPRVNATRIPSTSSKYYRVSYNSTARMYYVRLSINSRIPEHFGCYFDEEEAAFWSDVWAFRLLAPNETLLNFPDRLEEIKEAALKVDNPNLKWRRDPHADFSLQYVV